MWLDRRTVHHGAGGVDQRTHRQPRPIRRALRNGALLLQHSGLHSSEEDTEGLTRGRKAKVRRGDCMTPVLCMAIFSLRCNCNRNGSNSGRGEMQDSDTYGAYPRSHGCLCSSITSLTLFLACVGSGSLAGGVDRDTVVDATKGGSTGCCILRASMLGRRFILVVSSTVG